MVSDPDRLKRFKPQAKKYLKKRLASIEKEVNIKIPPSFSKLFDDAFENVYPESEEQYLELSGRTVSDLSNSISLLTKKSENLNPECKDFLDRLVGQLFIVTKGKGMGFEFWEHLPQEWFLFQASSDVDLKGIKENNIQVYIHLALSAYAQIYEFTLQFLKDVALLIARNTSQNDTKSREFVRLCDKHKRRNRTISRGDLISYFNSQNFLENWKCPVVTDATIRNKVSHADYSYDEVEKCLVFGNRSYQLDEFLDVLKNLYSFYCYFILKLIAGSEVYAGLFANKEQNRSDKE
jgi:hypothetical protein